jgi:hypothetical protein
MKKLLYAAALMAMMILPMMTSCNLLNPDINPDNQPQDTVPTPQEQFEDWSAGTDSLKVPVSVDGLVGTWRHAFSSDKYKDSTNINGWNFISDTTQEGTYWEIKKDMSIITYNFMLKDEVMVVYKSEGRWTLQDSKYFIVDWGETIDEEKVLDKYTVEYLEADRFVVSRLLPGDENIPDRIWYTGYTRVAQLPELPENPRDRLTAQPWKVISDTVAVYTHTTVEYGPDDIRDIRLLKEQKVNQLVTGGTFTIKENGVFTITNAKGEVIGEYTWKDYEDNDPTVRPINITPTGRNDLNLETFITFYPQLNDPNSGCFYTSAWDYSDNNVIYEYIYGFRVEAVKQ